MPEWLFFRAFRGTNPELSTLDYVYMGQPFVYVPAKTTVNLSTLDYFYHGFVFVSYARG